MSYVCILNWSDINDYASAVFDDWIDYHEWISENFNEFELSLINYIDSTLIHRIAVEGFKESFKNAWEILVQIGLANYCNETEHCEVMIAFISLVELYAESCGFEYFWMGKNLEYDYFLDLVEAYLEISHSQLTNVFLKKYGIRFNYNSSPFKSEIFKILIKNKRQIIINTFQDQFGMNANLFDYIRPRIAEKIKSYLNDIKFNEDDEFEREETELIYENQLIDKLTKRWQEVVMDEVTLAAQKLAAFFDGNVINITEEITGEAVSHHYGKSQIILLRRYVEPSFTDIQKNVLAQDIHISEQTLRRYHLAIKTRKFVILAGISGTGKTWLTKIYANAVDAEYLVVPVAPNWTTNEDLLGYFNPINKEYNHTAFSCFLEKAAQEYILAKSQQLNPQPYHLVLDEMNLARVEYYFAKFLSAMEVRMREEVAEIELAPGKKVLLPPNLYFIGTVNMDETTHSFADKVYDRAQLIELEVDRKDLYDCLGEVEYRETLIQIWDEVYTVAPFAFRVIEEIKTYVKEAEALNISWKQAFDEQLLQKVLPKLKGTDETVGKALKAVVNIAKVNGFHLSHKKAEKMLETFNNHGFSSYF
ncbi:hypothetical protein MiSe_28010 [Microseira wollei NIES-4236]|uniref:ATPase dynein-related AAA domain-containing protein n=2 Tax=Microseira wollei TaxID=467598 RepID=A0AAV3XCJ9_9CYAN|nr:hypothetical protein MiSe_28010 [Microseira wollei NIES-4236]